MKDIDLYSLQMSDIALFLNVARYGSFTKAGEKMFVSQSWVSKRIAQMEKELELILFIRNRREVILPLRRRPPAPGAERDGGPAGEREGDRQSPPGIPPLHRHGKPAHGGGKAGR